MGSRRLLPLLTLIAFLGGCASPARPVVTHKTAVDRPDVKLPPLDPAVPGFRLEMRGRATEATVRRIERITGVSVAVPLSTKRMLVSYGGAVHSLRIVAVEPLAFRNVAPSNTGTADFVWTSLLDGRAVLTGDASRDLGFESGDIEVGGVPITVGAFADNGELGDVLLADHMTGKVGLRAASQLIVGVSEKAKLETIRTAIKQRLGGDVSGIRSLQPDPEAPPAETPDPVGTAEGDLIGSMNFRILKNGYIDPDPAWVAANIASGEVPILGSVTCHRLLFPQLGAALAEIERENLAGKIDRADFGGCYVPRFIARDPRRGLSMHAFGLAVDLNVSTNYLGTRGDIDQRIVAIFEKWGFAWGGRWSQPDPMHFELARLIDT